MSSVVGWHWHFCSQVAGLIREQLDEVGIDQGKFLKLMLRGCMSTGTAMRRRDSLSPGACVRPEAAQAQPEGSCSLYTLIHGKVAVLVKAAASCSVLCLGWYRLFGHEPHGATHATEKLLNFHKAGFWLDRYPLLEVYHSVGVPGYTCLQ